MTGDVLPGQVFAAVYCRFILPIFPILPVAAACLPALSPPPPGGITGRSLHDWQFSGRLGCGCLGNGGWEGGRPCVIAGVAAFCYTKWGVEQRKLGGPTSLRVWSGGSLPIWRPPDQRRGLWRSRLSAEGLCEDQLKEANE